MQALPLLPASGPRCALFAALALAVPLVAQQRPNFGVELMANFKPNDAFNDVWGYVDPASGREFALLLSVRGTYFVETTDPRNPVQRGWFPASLSGWRTSTWRDARTFGNRAYIVTESGGGCQILDLSNVDAPRYVGLFRPGGISWNNSHNVAVDVERGTLWACGTSGGVHAFDLNANPDAPPYIGSYTREYVHDLHVVDGRTYQAEFNRAQFRILDVASFPTFQYVTNFPAGSVHNCWPTRDGSLVALTTETNNGEVAILDVTRGAQFRASYRLPWGVNDSPHNVLVRDHVAHIAYYKHGYAALDLTVPTQPELVAYYDTSSRAGLFDGAWGVYPFQPSGVVYISDRQEGLFVLRPSAVAPVYGGATTGASGSTPELTPRGAPYLGSQTFALDLWSAPVSSTAFVLVGAARRDVNLLGVRVLVDQSIGLILDAATDAAGRATFGVPVPNDPALDGVDVQVQAVVADPNGGFAASQGRTLHLYAK